MQQKIGKLRGLMAAVNVLTIIRRPKNSSGSEEALRSAQIFLPAVGLVLGLGLAAIYSVLTGFLPIQVSVVAVLAVALIVTGARNEGALGGVADAISRGVRQTRSETLRSGLLGLPGTSTIVLVLLLKFALLGYLTPIKCRHALWVGEVMAYWMVIAFRQMIEYVNSKDGFGIALEKRLARRDFIIITILCCAVTLFLGWISAVATWLLTLIFLFVTGQFLKRYFGGLTSQTARAVVVAGEILTYLAVTVYGS